MGIAPTAAYSTPPSTAGTSVLVWFTTFTTAIYTNRPSVCYCDNNTPKEKGAEALRHLWHQDVQDATRPGASPMRTPYPLPASGP